MLKLIRRILAVIFCLGITWLFVDVSGMAHHQVAWMAKLQFLPSVMALNWVSIAIVLVLTLLLGRIYCSVICPLGVLQDVFAWIGKWRIFRKNKKAKFANRYSYSKPKTWLRWVVLALFVIMMVAGFNAGAVLLAPYSSYGRMVSSLLQPAYIYINNVLAAWAETNGSYQFVEVEMHDNPLMLIVIAGVTAIVLFVLAFMHGRTYCNTICPVGTVLGYVSKVSLFKMQVQEDKCIKCGLCEKNCKAACIKVEKGKPVQFDYTRCVACGDCQTVCGKKALHLAPVGSGKNRNGQKGQSDQSTLNTLNHQNTQSTPNPQEGDLSRRSFLTVTATSAVAAALNAQEKTTDGGLAVIEDKQIPTRKTPITPPGSLSAKNLRQHCTACQLCIANCPNRVLRPSQRLENFMQPEMQYDKGYCRPECTRCSSVCPAGAIRPIEKDDKLFIQIGHAVWVKENCIPLTDQKTCGNCAKHCPAGAIQMVPVDKSYKQDPESGQWTDAEGNVMNDREILKIPVVNAEECIGCGACENLCPARPFSAIYVEGHEIHKEV